MPSEQQLRPIEPRDDAPLAAMIRSVMQEFGADGPGFAIHDAEVAAMHAAYGRPRCAYFVWEQLGRVIGGAGIAPLEGGDGLTCELRKMYFLPEARGLGVGEAMLRQCLSTAVLLGYARCYLETLANMQAAQRLYQRVGFRAIPGALGSTGHFGCNRFYLLELSGWVPDG